jgi:5-bromo-4-chloroindolyl phosphate hydrolysis protein
MQEDLEDKVLEMHEEIQLLRRDNEQLRKQLHNKEENIKTLEELILGLESIESISNSNYYRDLKEKLFYRRL